MSCIQAMPHPAYAAANSTRRQYSHPSQSSGPVSGKKEYEIMSDGTKFGVAFQGEIKIHGLEYARAQHLAELLNSVGELETTP
jgi:hypothetical protein